MLHHGWLLFTLLQVVLSKNSFNYFTSGISVFLLIRFLLADLNLPAEKAELVRIKIMETRRPGDSMGLYEESRNLDVLFFYIQRNISH